MLFCLKLLPHISFAVFIILCAIMWFCRMFIHKNAFWTHSKLFFAGMLIVVVLALIPIVYYLDIPENTALRDHTPDGFTASFNCVIALKDYFTFDADFTKHIEVIRLVTAGSKMPFANILYILWIMFLAIIAPITTISFIVSFFGNALQFIRFIWASRPWPCKKNLCVFSDLNEKSIVLATDLATKDTSIKNTIVFTNAKDNDLLPQAKSIGAICLSKSIMEYDIHKKNVCLYLMSEDEPQNTILAMRLKEKYKGKASPKIKMNVFATGKSSELQLSNASDDLFIVRRINAVQMLIYSLLDTTVLFDTAQDFEGHKLIHAVILGMGERGTEMVKALSWFCQKDDYVLKIDAFDKDPLAKEKFSALCPELMSSPEYDITIHSGVDTDTEEFIEEFNRLNIITYVFVSLGSDERNVKNAVCIQTLLERRPEIPSHLPYIHAAVSKEEYALAKQKKTAPGKSILEQVGELEKNYSNKCLFPPEFEEAARCVHELWNHSDKDYERFMKMDFDQKEKLVDAAIEIQKKDPCNPFYEEYNYRSSLASAIHIIAIGPCPKEGKTARTELEHRRWCAYQRSEGYIVGPWSEKEEENEKGEKVTKLIAKNKAARTHADLVPYDDLGDNKPGNDENKKKTEQDKDLILINNIDLILSYYNKEENEKLCPAKEKD